MIFRRTTRGESVRGGLRRAQHTATKPVAATSQGTISKYRPKNSPVARAHRFAGRSQPTFHTAANRPLPTSGSGLKIYPLGGQEEVGRNCTVFEYDNDIVILDMGLQFPDEDMPGIDYIIPNVSSLKGKERNIRGVIFSHGHLDHIGAAPILLEHLGNPPIIGRNLTLAMIKHRQEDYKRGTTKNLKTIPIHNISQVMQLGKFTVKFFRVEHSIVDAVGVILQTPHGTVIHPGDWTIEDDPLSGERIDYEHLASLPPGRIIIGTFASQLERITQLLAYAEKIGKKVALDGYSMKMNVKIAQELGYIPAHKNILIPVEDIHKYPENKILLICTGAQGEANAVFARIVNGSHRSVTIKKSDVVVFSSSVIPGNERSIQKIKDQIYRLSDNVIHNDIMDVHSGGHANAEDIKRVLHQIKPDYFLPVYAHYFMLVEAKKLALREGFRDDQVFVLENGQIIEFARNKKPQVLKKKVNTDYVMVDGLGIGDVSEVVLRDRQVMSEDGMLVVIATIYSKTGKLVGNPDIISRGFIYMKDNKDLVEKTRKKITEIVMSGDTKSRAKADENFIKNKLRNDLGQFLFQKTKRRPMVLPVIIKV